MKRIYEEIVPEKLEKKDMLILKELDKNARASFSQMGKNLKMSKEVVNYRIKRMMKMGLISNFNTIIDACKIGWEMFSIYIRLKNIDVKKEDEIVQRLVQSPNVSWLKRCIGGYDIVLKVFAKDYEHADDLMKEIEDEFKGYIDEVTRDMVVNEQFAPFAMVYEPLGKPKQTVMSRDNEKVSLSQEDKLILRELSNNARLNVVELSNKLNIPVDTIRYRLKRLERTKVILHYRPSIWPRIFGYSWFYIILRVRSLSPETKKQLEELLLNRYNEITYLYRAIGGSDIQIEIRARNNEHLGQIMIDIRDIFRNVLRGHEALIVLDEPKFTYFPECLMES